MEGRQGYGKERKEIKSKEGRKEVERTYVTLGQVLSQECNYKDMKKEESDFIASVKKKQLVVI